MPGAGFHGAQEQEVPEQCGRDIPTGILLLLLLEMQEDHAHEDVLLFGNTQDEAQAVSGKTCPGSWEMQEELEGEIKLSV